VTSEITLSFAFVTGILGSYHCIGMCSGINGGFFVYARSGFRLMPLLAFHGMRLGIYTLLGISGAVLGQVLVQSGIVGKIQGILMILAGLLILVLGLRLLNIISWNKKDKLTFNVSVPLSTLDEPLSMAAVVSAGLFNGLVPCSLVFSVAVKAVSSADPLYAGLIMASFGAGTLPSMIAVTLLGAWIGAKARGVMAKLSGLGVVLLGLWTLYEGFIFYDVMRGLANW
jgi:sulfite exporter TauE/SafE